MMHLNSQQQKFTGRIKTGGWTTKAPRSRLDSSPPPEVWLAPSTPTAHIQLIQPEPKAKNGTLKVEALLLAAETPRWYSNLLGNPVFSLDGLMEALLARLFAGFRTLLLRGEEKRVTSIGNALHRPVRRGRGEQGRRVRVINISVGGTDMSLSSPNAITDTSWAL
ncbi:hypothetical protein CSAL01_04836 [Colletotrichum salicis]|uniref:Uncharacterized protein n=1 Tax=Colletotrichum salicis TaxID=1209931 RepID=A0A135UD49_9PEZI|nr:hypothetical protein CSAL01_04836 [Colletotrichum salicis]